MGQNHFILLLRRLLDLPYIFQYGPGGFNVASQPWTRDPITSIASLKSGSGTQKIYRENQNVVLNTTFAQNHQYIYFVLKQITNSLDISLLLGQNRFILVLKQLLNLPYIFQLGPRSRLF